MEKKTMVIVVVLIIVAIGVYLYLSGNIPQLNNLFPSQNQTNTSTNVPETNNTAENNSGQTETPSGIQTLNVEIKNFVFNPSEIIIETGDTVTWTNTDSSMHSVFFDLESEADSSTFGKGETFSHTFNTAGTYTYHCGSHKSMKGTVIVQ